MSLACGIGLGSTFGPQGAFLVELFETRFRLTGIAVARGFNGVAVSGLTPLIASALILFAGGGAGYVIAYLAFWQVVSIVGAVFARAPVAPTKRIGFYTQNKDEQWSLSYDDSHEAVAPAPQQVK
jgi:MFS family permease